MAVNAPTSADARNAEIAALRARVAELEGELRAQAQASARVVAEAQDKLYWLERWHVDLDRFMRRRWAQQALALLRFARSLTWHARKLKRRVLPPR